MENSLRPNAAEVRNVRSAARACVFALFAIGLGACSDSTAPGELPGLTITAPTTIHFTKQAGGYRQIAVPVTITNGTSGRLEVMNCSESVERFTLASWQLVWAPVCLAIIDLGSSPIEPGTTRTVTLTVADTPSQYDGFRFTDAEKVYRARFSLVLVDGNRGTNLPVAVSVSNPFQVVP